jgi:hypothetical protein
MQQGVEGSRVWALIWTVMLHQLLMINKLWVCNKPLGVLALGPASSFVLSST